MTGNIERIERTFVTDQRDLSSKKSGDISSWNHKKVTKLGKTLDSITESVVSLTKEKESISNRDQKIGSLLEELSKIIHLLDETVSPEDAEHLIDLGNKVHSCIEQSLISLPTEPSSVNMASVLLVKETFISLDEYNLAKLDELKTSVETGTLSTFASLDNISSNREITGKMKQVQVLSQYEDTTVSGFENCGYHALKNALLAQVPGKSSKELAKMFHDKELFLAFYKTYCLPELEKTGAKKGKADASVPILREVIKSIANDSKCPEKLIPVQIALRKSIEHGSLAIFQMSTTTGDDRGSPLFGFFDAQGALEAQKIFQLVREPGPQILSCVFGNEVLGHWYTLVIFKDEADEIGYIGMDSMDNSHDTLGIYSALGKMKNLLQTKIENPVEFLKTAFSPLNDFLSPRENWFEPDGSISNEYAESLLDDLPFPALATEDAPTGSTLERNLVQCAQAFHFFQSTELLNSSDYWIQKQLNALEKLVNFYAVNLPSTHPRKTHMQDILEEIQLNKRHEIVEEIIVAALVDIEKRKKELTHNEYNKIKTLFTHTRTLFRGKKEISQAANETERINLMNSMGKVNGIEHGFTSGSKSSEIEKSLMEKVDILLLTYQEASRRGEFLKLIQTVASGDGCHTAKMGRVNELYAEYKGLGQIADLVSAEKIKESPVTALSESISRIATQYVSDKAKLLLDQITSISISENPETVAESLKDYATGDLGMPFRKFLFEEGIITRKNLSGDIPEAEEIDWAGSLEKILDNKEKIKLFVDGDPSNVYDPGDKEERYSIEMKGFIHKLKIDDLLEEEKFNLIVSDFITYCSSGSSIPFREFLVEKNVIPDVEVSDWRKAVSTAMQLEEFNVWLSYAKEQALNFL